MKTEKYTGKDGGFWCFGFPNTFIGKKGALKQLLKIPGVEVQEFYNQFGTEVICEFTLGNKKFELTEPYGDNSYYDITCEEPDTKELTLLFNHFNNLKLPTRAQKVYLLLFIAVCVFLVVSNIL